MAEKELWTTLMQFHREVVRPDLEELRDEIKAVLGEMVTRDEFLSHVNAIYKRFDRLETEYDALRIAVQRLESRIAAVEEKLDKMALRTELVELKEHLAQLQERVAQLEKQLN